MLKIARSMISRTIAIAILLAILAFSQTLSLATRDAFNEGVVAFQAGQFLSAARSFGRVVEVAPTLLTARVYLAAALVQAYVPNRDTPENKAVGDAAISACQEVLKRDANNVPATDSLATLYFQMKDFNRSREWNLRVLALDPMSKTSLYMLGAISWSEFILTLREARITVGLTPTDPGPLPDEELRAELRAQSYKHLTEGIEFERAALNIDAAYGPAMLAMADLYKARADLGAAADYEADMKESAVWSEKGKALTSQGN